MSIFQVVSSVLLLDVFDAALHVILKFFCEFFLQFERGKGSLILKELLVVSLTMHDAACDILVLVRVFGAD